MSDSGNLIIGLGALGVVGYGVISVIPKITDAIVDIEQSLAVQAQARAISDVAEIGQIQARTINNMTGAMVFVFISIFLLVLAGIIGFVVYKLNQKDTKRYPIVSHKYNKDDYNYNWKNYQMSSKSEVFADNGSYSGNEVVYVSNNQDSGGNYHGGSY